MFYVQFSIIYSSHLTSPHLILIPSHPISSLSRVEQYAITAFNGSTVFDALDATTGKPRPAGSDLYVDCYEALSNME